MSPMVAAALTWGALAVSGPAADTTDTVVAREVGRIGSIGGPDAITRPASLHVDPDGSLLVLFPVELIVRRMTPEGEFLETIGGRGAGPGEFLRPVGMDAHNGRVWVFETERVSRFDLGSGEATTVRLTSRNGAPPDRMPRLSGVLPSGTLVVDREPRGVRRANDSVPLIAATPDGSLGDTLAVVQRREIVVYQNPRPGAFGELSVPRPFPESDLWAVHRAMPGIVVADVTSRRQHGEVVLRTYLEGGTVYDTATLQTTDTPQVSDAERREMIRRHVDAVMWSRGLSVRSEREARSLVNDALGTLDFRSPVERIIAASDGTIWIKTPDDNETVDDQTSVWLVLSPQLDPLRWVSIDADLTLLNASGDRAWAVVRDELDVSYLVELDVGTLK